MTIQSDRCRVFHELHASGCFVIPNPWDVGSARALERIRAARRAIGGSGTQVLLTGRSEGFIAGRPDLDETIARLIAYAQAGADCLHAPGLQRLEDIAAVVKAVAPKPVNVLVWR